MDSLDTMLDELSKIVKPLVESIEAKPETTKGHYGDYMMAVDKLAQMVAGPDKRNDKAVCIAVGVALQRAGANKDGVKSALHIMGYI